MDSCVNSHSGSEKSLNCSTCPVLGKGAWRELNDSGLKQLNKIKTQKVLKRGEHLFHQGDVSNGVWCLVSGQISVKTVDDQGRSILLRIGTEGETIGARSFFAKEKHSAGAQALTRSHCCFIRKEAINELLEDHPKIALRFLEIIASNLRVAHETVLRGATMNLRERLTYLLLEFGRQFGTETVQRSVAYTLPVSRRDLAELLGTCPESLSRAIRKLREDGVVQIKMNKVNIASMAELQKSLDSPRRQIGF